MATGGALSTEGDCDVNRIFIDVREEWRASFETLNPLSVWHFEYHQIVSEHNNLHHELLHLDHTWNSTSWPIDVFTFLLSIIDVNTYIVFKHQVYYDNNLPKYTHFCKKLMYLFMSNNDITEEDKRAHEHLGTTGK